MYDIFYIGDNESLKDNYPFAKQILSTDQIKPKTKLGLLSFLNMVKFAKENNFKFYKTGAIMPKGACSGWHQNLH